MKPSKYILVSMKIAQSLLQSFTLLPMHLSISRQVFLGMLAGNVAFASIFLGGVCEEKATFHVI